MNRQDFPILSRQVYGRPLVYLDNGATTQKPRCVIDAMTDEYLNVNANVHRGVHYLSQQATDLHEQARETVRRFINARSTAEVVFTRGTTESINLIASSFAQAFLREGDEIILTEMEHHSNIVPWQLAQTRTPSFPSAPASAPSPAPSGAVPPSAQPNSSFVISHSSFTIKVCPITDEGRLDMEAFRRLFTPRTRLVSCTAVSNVLGTVNPVAEIIRIAHAHDVPVLIDAAQAAPHMPIDVQALDCDFLAFSGHKVYGPTGIGVLYGKEAWLDRLPPYMGGGEMIGKVSFEHTTFNSLPYKFEAGTPDYVASTGLARALDYVSAIGMDRIEAHEKMLTRYAREQLSLIPGMRFFGPSDDAVISFLVGDIHHFDLGTLLDRLGIAVRTGHHCAEPLMHRLGIEGTVRASFALYNTREEVDALVAGIDRVRAMF